MSRILAVSNQKGGVGKTTTAVNLAAALAHLGRRVLLIDLDPQGHATMGSGIDKHTLAGTSCEVLLEETTLPAALIALPAAGFSLLPANSDLTAAEVKLMQVDHGERRLRSALQDAQTSFDDILIDCPPALNMLTLNALTAAHGVLIPVQCEFYALEGLSALLDTISRVRATANPGLRVAGVLRTLYDTRNNLTSQVSQELERHFGAQVYRAVIPRNVRLAEAPSYGLPILLYDRTSSGALAYTALAQEMVEGHAPTALENSIPLSRNYL